MEKGRTVECWHFLNNERTLRFDDPRPVKLGEKLEVSGTPILCEWGFHGSRKAIDALGYAPGDILCRVEIGGEIVEGGDKLSGQTRRVLAWADATATLQKFACDCALDVAHLWEAPEVVVQYLKTQDETLRAAARAAARAARAAWAAAWAAARDAAWAARSAARDAARDAQNERLESAFRDLLTEKGESWNGS